MITNIELKQLILNSSAPFLIASRGMWINSDGNELYFNEMDQAYKRNCYNLLVREEKNIESEFYKVLGSVDEVRRQEILNKVKELYYAKLRELIDELK